MRRFIGLLLGFLLAMSCHAGRKVTWVIDAGHGGHDVGCEGRISREKDISLSVAKEVGKLIKKNIKGVNVIFTRERDKYLTLQERCDIANVRGAALFLSIHVNSAENPFARGTESFFATNVPLTGTNAGKSELLALLLQRQYLSHGREISRGVKKRELYVIEHTNMPSVLTEVGFISNLSEEEYLTSKKGVEELASSICQALGEWKEMTKNGTVPQRVLRNLRFSHYAPVYQASATEEPPATEQPSKAETPQPAPTNARQPSPEEKPLAPTGDAPAKADALPYFAIQLMNTATVLKSSDKRLKGFKEVRHVPTGGRYKVLYGRYGSYKEVKNQLTKVRKHFPEAFIVAFCGEEQISTAEALKLLSNER